MVSRLNKLNSFEGLDELRVHFDITPSQLLSLRFKKLIQKLFRPSTDFTSFDCLVRLEPFVVLPITYKLNRNTFDLILDLGFRNDSSIAWPQHPMSLSLKLKHNSRKETFCLIAANKLSLVKGELYTLRKRVALAEPRIDLYGNSWGLGLPRKLLLAVKAAIFALGSGAGIKVSSLRYWLMKSPKNGGPIVDKFEVQEKHRFALVVENQGDYVSEKIFDALGSAMIPIYVGPRVDELGWIESLIIRAEPFVESIKESMVAAEQVDYSLWLNRLQEVWTDKNLAMHRLENVCDAIARKIVKAFREKQAL